MSEPGRDTPITISREVEQVRGWCYHVTIRRPSGGTVDYRVTLSWADHDLISGGVCPPSRTVEAALGVLLEAGPMLPGTLPSRFDLSTVRRMIEGFDDLVRARL